MITILPDNEYTKCPFIDKAYDEKTFVLTAKDGEEYLGYGAVTMYEDYACLLDIVCAQGFESLDHGIGKSVLNFVERRSIYDVICTSQKLLPLLKRLGFKEAQDEWKTMSEDGNMVFCLNLQGYFDKHC